MRTLLTIVAASLLLSCTQEPRLDMLEVTKGSSVEERANYAIAVSKALWEEGFPTAPCEPGTKVNPDDPNEITAFDLTISATIENDTNVFLQCSISDEARYDYILEQCRQRILEKLRS